MSNLKKYRLIAHRYVIFYIGIKFYEYGSILLVSVFKNADSLLIISFLMFGCYALYKLIDTTCYIIDEVDI